MIYREVIRTPMIEVCPLMKTTSSLRLVSQVIKMFKDSAPEMVHECPYHVRAYSLREKVFMDQVHVHRGSKYTTEA